MNTNDYEASVLFKQNHTSTAHIVVNQGGTSSGKTYAIEQVLFCLACETGKQIITVVGQDIPNLKAGALRDALNIYSKSDQLKKLVKSYNKTDRIFEFYNESTAMPKSTYLFRLFLFICYFSLNSFTGDSLRIKVKRTYDAEVGVREKTGNNDGVRVETYLRYVGLDKGNPWCASFVCWAFGQSGITNPRSGYCPDLFLTKRIIYKRTRKSNHQPKQGDVWGLYFPEKGRIAHVGFVDQWQAKYVITVEGNTNEAGSREGDGVYRKRRPIKSIYVVANYIDKK